MLNWTATTRLRVTRKTTCKDWKNIRKLLRNTPKMKCVHKSCLYINNPFTLEVNWFRSKVNSGCAIATDIYINQWLYYYFRDRGQILFLILRKFKRVNWLLFPPKLFRKPLPAHKQYWLRYSWTSLPKSQRGSIPRSGSWGYRLTERRNWWSFITGSSFDRLAGFETHPGGRRV